MASCCNVAFEALKLEALRGGDDDEVKAGLSSHTEIDYCKRRGRGK